ncbi:hypothetical protein TrLO_g2970 [Triparma laevis f. longispina]|uniref:HORMA domain-containing protein n=1 Tax=Triparma laevis f. longispina TaxID=1714387 RepID=A0A9W7A5U0_9STRA|nr:hypothetical protein TrLO_g2970 [Triparma laevis f. longispina]
MTTINDKLSLLIGTIAFANSFFPSTSFTLVTLGSEGPQFPNKDDRHPSKKQKLIAQSPLPRTYYTLNEAASEGGGKSLMNWLNHGVLAKLSKGHLCRFTLAVYTVRYDNTELDVLGYSDPTSNSSKASLLTYEFTVDEKVEEEEGEGFLEVLEELREEERRRDMGLWKVEGLQRFISMEIEYVEEEREEGKENVAPTMFSEPSPMSCMDGASVMEHTDLGFFSTEKHVITVHINKRGTENKAALALFAALPTDQINVAPTPATQQFTPANAPSDQINGDPYFSPMATSEVSTLIMQTQTPSTVDLTQGIFF